MADERAHPDSAIDADDADDHHEGACCNACAFSARVESPPAIAPPASGPLRFAIVDGRPVGAVVTVRASRGAAVEVFPVVGLAVRLGRGPDNDVVVRDIKLSRRQATVSFDDDGVTVTDAGCGTFVNGKPVRPRARLQVGDRIYVGDTLLEVRRA